jgi:hypothetical protein
LSPFYAETIHVHGHPKMMAKPRNPIQMPKTGASNQRAW